MLHNSSSLFLSQYISLYCHLFLSVFLSLCISLLVFHSLTKSWNIYFFWTWGRKTRTSLQYQSLMLSYSRLISTNIYWLRRQEEKQVNRETSRQADRQTETNRQTDKQTSQQAGIHMSLFVTKAIPMSQPVIEKSDKKKPLIQRCLSIIWISTHFIMFRRHLVLSRDAPQVPDHVFRAPNEQILLEDDG